MHPERDCRPPKSGEVEVHPARGMPLHVSPDVANPTDVGIVVVGVGPDRIEAEHAGHGSITKSSGIGGNALHGTTKFPDRSIGHLRRTAGPKRSLRSIRNLNSVVPYVGGQHRCRRRHSRFDA